MNKIAVVKRQSNDNGFTLIELMVTIIVLGIVITSMSMLYYLVQQTENNTQTYDLAVRDARTEIEDLRNNDYDSLNTGSFSFSPLPGLPRDATGSVAVCAATTAIPNPCPAGLKRIDVTISYTLYGNTTNVTLSSDIGIIGIAQ